jgi:C-terminal processing protease CtpA/Prc
VAKQFVRKDCFSITEKCQLSLGKANFSDRIPFFEGYYTVKILLMRHCVFFVLIVFAVCQACVSVKNYDPNHKFSPQQLQSDFALMRQALEEGHPGMYRYITKDSMNYWFERTAALLNRDMTEREFRNTINPLISYVRCGHTDVYASLKGIKYAKKKKPKLMPIQTIVAEGQLRVWNNNSNDTTLRRGEVVLAVDGQTTEQLFAQIRDVSPSDGYNTTYKDLIIANNFPAQYRLLYGEKDSIRITVRDSLNQVRTVLLTERKAVVKPKKPTSVPSTPPKPATPPAPKVSKQDKRRTLKFSTIDSATAVLDINTFGDRSYKKFYRRSFKQIAQRPHIRNLILDLRSNGGGRSAASADLIGYVVNQPYRYYARATARFRRPSFNRHLNQKFPRFVIRNFFSSKLPDGGMEHVWSGKVFKPHTRYHFDGDVYVLANGGTFSAAAIFTAVTQGQSRATVIGRETGGGRKGLNANFMPYLNLPQTQVRIRFPMFKLITDAPGEDVGRGVFPDYPVQYTYKDYHPVSKDTDMDKAYELIKKKKIP